MFLRQFLILILTLQSVHTSFAQARSCGVEQTPNLLRRIFSPKISEREFNVETFNADLKRLQRVANEGELERIIPSHLNSQESKLALFELLTTQKEKSIFDFETLVKDADDDQMKRISGILDRFTPDNKGKISAFSSQKAIEDLYWLSHPANRTLKDYVFGRASNKEIDRLIEARVKFAFAHGKVETALKELGWADAKTSTRLKVWLKDHPTAQSALIFSAVDVVKLGGPEVLTHFMGVPAFALPWQSFIGFPAFRLMRPTTGELESLGKLGHDELMPYLLQKYKRRSQAELAYSYYVRPAIYVGLTSYMIADNWNYIKNGVRFGATFFKLSNENLAKAQSKVKLIDAQQAQAHAAIFSAFLDAEASQEVVSPTLIWQLVQENVTLKKSDLLKDYVPAKNPAVKEDDAVPLTADFIERSGLQVLANLKQEGKVQSLKIDETQTAFKQWMALQKEFQNDLPKGKDINLDEAEKVAHLVMQKNHAAEDPDTIRTLVLQSLQSQVDQRQFIALKKEYVNKRQARSPN